MTEPKMDGLGGGKQKIPTEKNIQNILEKKHPEMEAILALNKIADAVIARGHKIPTDLMQEIRTGMVNLTPEATRVANLALNKMIVLALDDVDKLKEEVEVLHRFLKIPDYLNSRRVCGWCKKDMGESGTEKDSHGICDECFERTKDDWL